VEIRVSSLPDDNLADNLANQQGIRHARADGRSVLLGVLDLEKDVDHRHQVVLVSIADQGKAAGKLDRVVR